MRKRKVFTVLYPTVPTLNYQYHKFLRCRHPHINLSREDRLSRKRKRRENEADYILGLQLVDSSINFNKRLEGGGNAEGILEFAIHFWRVIYLEALPA